MYSPITIANYFIQKSIATGIELTPMKLVKLVYIAHGWYLGLTKGKGLINEAVIAWDYGPVIESLYHSFKRYGRSQITAQENIILGSNEGAPIDSSTQTFLDKIWQVYGGYSGLQLSALTHENNTPWHIIYQQNRGKNTIIPNNLIQQHYESKANGSRK